MYSNLSFVKHAYPFRPINTSLVSGHTRSIIVTTFSRPIGKGGGLYLFPFSPFIISLTLYLILNLLYIRHPYRCRFIRKRREITQHPRFIYSILTRYFFLILKMIKTILIYTCLYKNYHSL